jgi:hypothetical protein
MQTTKAWLSEVSWDSVVSINESKCRDYDAPHQLNTDHAKAKATWEAHQTKTTTLMEALELCRLCNDIRPFVYHCSNTFTSIAKTLVEDWARQLDSVDAHLLCTTVTHYVDGRIRPKELRDTLRYLESKPRPAKATSKSSTTIIPPIQQRQPA